MTSQVQAGGCQFELKHLPVHFLFVVVVVAVVKTLVATMGMKSVNPGSVSAMLYGAV